MRSMRNRFVIPIVLAAGLLVTSCGSDDDSGAGGTTAAPADTTAATPGDTTAVTPAATDGTTAPDTAETDATTPAAGATGDPVRVMIIVDDAPALGNPMKEPQSGASARIDRINATSGLGGSGRPVELVVCNSELDPNKGADCARQAADDPTIIAVVGVNTGVSDFNPVFEEAGLANIGQQPVSAGDSSSDISFPVVGGIIGAGGGQATIAHVVLGAKKIVHGRVGIDVIQGVTDLINGVLASYGADPVTNTVDVAIGSTDVSAQVAAMATDADVVALSVLTSQVQPILHSRAQQGITVPFIINASSFGDAAVKAAGDEAEGINIVCSFAPDDVDVPGVHAYLDDIAAAGAEDTVSELSRIGWTGVDLLDYAMQGETTFTRESVLAAIRKVNDYDAGGMSPKVDFTKPGANPAFPSIRNLQIFPCVVKDGKIVSAGDGFIPVFGG
jgi:ABC-type branched-subunit amino acid transport system substrate-binding protein